MRAALPIDPLLPRVVEALRDGNRLILQAEPGAGKTTRVPAALLDSGCAGQRQIVVLEPRRLAARAAAAFVAHERGQNVGAEVGYRVRYESSGGPRTRLWFLTEGVFSRQLIGDPFLEQVGIVILDEFHERHLSSDIALGIVRELQESVRSDLRLVVMSATLEADRLAAYLGNCPVLRSQGRQYPVALSYCDAGGSLSARVLSAVELALANRDDGGDMLVFLPGAAEIRRCAESLQSIAQRHAIDIRLLHGDLSLEAQQQAVTPGPRRKLVLSTNVAETSLTIEGVTTVIDCGLAREARFDARRGLNSLRTINISQAAATQRAGRAGRTKPGRCIRLGTSAADQQRRAFETPEVMRLDLAATVLELRAWGAGDLQQFAWLDAPPQGALGRAETLLRQLDALGDDGRLTGTGQRMLALPLEPRLARCLVEAERRGCVAQTALAAALASERDIILELRTFGAPQQDRWAAGRSDLALRAELFRTVARQHFSAAACDGVGLDTRSVRAVERARRQMLRLLRVADESSQLQQDDERVLQSLLAGFPDRLCRRRVEGSQRALMVGGTGVRLSAASVVRSSELFLAIEVEAGGRREGGEAEVRLASAVEQAWLASVHPGSVRHTRELRFDAGSERVIEFRETWFHDLLLHQRGNADVGAQEAGRVLSAAARLQPESALTLTAELEQSLGRLAFLASTMPELELAGERSVVLAALAAEVAHGHRSFAETRSVDALATLRYTLKPHQWQTLQREAPAEYQLPSGRRVRIEYEPGRPPSVAAKLQELFGLRRTPRLAAGRAALVMQLLAPNGRPVQITSDLESFWTRTYPEIRKLLRGRYPKHPWPEDPLTAIATARTKRHSATGSGEHSAPRTRK